MKWIARDAVSSSGVPISATGIILDIIPVSLNIIINNFGRGTSSAAKREVINAHAMYASCNVPAAYIEESIAVTIISGQFRCCRV